VIAVIAHRGASIDHAENSPSAIRRARECGADFIEVDVRMTRDGGIVVHHDPDLLRSAGIPKRVSESDVAGLQAIDLRYLDHPSFRMPTLSQAIEAAAPVPLCVEIKTDGEERINALVDHTVDLIFGNGRSVVISFDDRVVRRARSRLPGERVGMIRNRDLSEDAWRDGLDADVDLVVLSKKITSHEAIGALRDKGRSVWAYALDDRDTIEQHLAWGVEGVISNRPDLAIEATQSWKTTKNPR